MKVESKASAAAWGTIRDSILVAVTENYATPVVVQCLSCKCTASYRCEQCGPFYCEECIKKSHSIMNLFHVLEKWKVGTYILIAYSYVYKTAISRITDISTE